MAKKNKQFIVIAPTGKTENCKIIAEGSVYTQIHTKRYGPASKDACEKWVASNCSKSSGPR